MAKNKLYYYLFYIILSFIGGFYEVYSFFNHSFFAFMQTGNLINIIIDIVKLDFFKSILNLISIITFLISFSIIEIIKKKIIKNDSKMFEYGLISLIILNILIIITPKEINNDLLPFKLFEIIFLTTYGSILLSSFKLFNNVVFVPTMMTNNTRRMIENAVDYSLSKDKNNLNAFLSYSSIIISFIVGAFTSMILHVYASFDLFLIKDIYSIDNTNIYSLIPLTLIIVDFIIYKKVFTKSNILKTN